MTVSEPVTDLDQRFSSTGASPTPWSEASQQLDTAEVFWLSTIRPDGRPHVTTLVAIWNDGALYFSTGPDERKAKNISGNPHCVLMTGCNHANEGLDVVVEGDAVRISDEAKLQILADIWKSKRGWQFEVRNGAFYGDGGESWVFEVVPRTAFGFGKGEKFSQTRWRF